MHWVLRLHQERSIQEADTHEVPGSCSVQVTSIEHPRSLSLPADSTPAERAGVGVMQVMDHAASEGEGGPVHTQDPGTRS